MKKRISASFGIMLIAALLATALPVNTFGAFEISGSETTGSEFEDRLYDEESMDAGTVTDDVLSGTADFPGDELEDDAATDVSTTDELPTDENNTSGDQDDIVSDNNAGNDAGDPEGYIFPDETKYTITFAIEYEGVVKELNYKNNVALNTSKLLTDVLKPTDIIRIRTLTEYGFTDVKINDFAISSWRVNYDGRDYANSLISRDLSKIIETDFTEDAYKNLPKTVLGGHDYYYKARLVRKSAFNIYTLAVPDVYFDGRSHVSCLQEVNSGSLKSTVNDLDLHVYYCASNTWAPGDETELRFGRDYKVSYKNNKAASMKLESDGYGGYRYASLNLPDNKRPCVLITGLDEYTGFSTTVYFDIKPYNLGLNETVARIDGLKHIYSIKNNQITENPSPKVTLTIEGKTTTLAANKDYEPVIYKYDPDSIRWNKTSYTSIREIKYSGDYLYTVNGVGNYCGTAFGQDRGETFADGTKGAPFNINPKVCTYKNESYEPCQFRVTDSKKYDLANAKISIGKSSVPYRSKLIYGAYHASDFKIKVKDAEGTELDSGSYKLIFDGDDYDYVWGRMNSGSYIIERSDAKYSDSDGIFVANKYAIRIEAVSGGQYFGSQTTRSKVTIKGTAPGFSGIKFIGRSSVKYDGTYDILNADQYSYKSNCPVKPINPSNELSSYKTPYSGYDKYDYEKALPYLNPNSELVSTVISKEPGTYDRKATAFGPGTDHSKSARGTYRKTAITLKEAVANGLLTVSFPEKSYMNAGGSMPSVIKIVLGKGSYAKSHIISPVDPGGADKWLGSFYFNGQSFTVTDNGDPTRNDQSRVTLTLSASNNKDIGTGTLTIKGDGKLFNGSATVSYTISPKTVPSTVRVLTTTDKVRVSSPSDMIGTVYAVAQPVKKTNSPPSVKNITLYQSYYKNRNDAELGLASLAKIDAKRYKITLTPYSGSANVYNAKVSIPDGKAAYETGYDFATYGTKLSEKYGVYDQAVKIAKIEIEDEDDGGKSYTLPDDKPAAEYTGKQITRYKVTKVLRSDGAEIPSFCYKVEYGSNVKAGKKGGLIRVTLTPDTTVETEFLYGGSATFYFEIKPKDMTTY